MPPFSLNTEVGFHGLNGTIGTAYSSTLTASSGTAPYLWTLASGSLPAGVGLNKNGTISGTPTSAGQSNFTVEVTDSSSPTQQASRAFSLSVVIELAITGTIKSNAKNGDPYSSTDRGSGGTPAYTWSISSGSLPPGLDLAGTTGTISGTPNQNGTYTFTLEVADSGSPEQSAAQVEKITVVTGTNAWTLQPTQVGWQFVAPDGAATCKYNAVSKVDDTDPQSAGTDAAILAKYGSWISWAQRQSNRLTSLGYTAAGMYSYRYSSSFPASGLPFAPTYVTSGYSMQDTAHDNIGPYHAKDLGYIPQKNGMKCGGNFYQGSEIDPYDPNTQAAFTDYLANDFIHGWNFANGIIVVPDEADFLFGLDQANNPNNAHPDIGLMIAANNPMVTKSRPGSPYYQSGTFTYTDKELYAKQALRDHLKTEYGGSIASLNTAWETNYTTWDTSDPAGLAGITNGTYQSWGGNAACSASGNPYACCTGSGTGSCTQGTGFLDENGSNIIKPTQSCGGKTGNGPQETDGWSNPVQIQTDVDNFVAVLAGKYAQELRSAWIAACGSTCPPMALPVYDGPWNGTASVYAAMAPYVDLFWVAPPWYNTLGAYSREVQNIIDNDGGKPVIVANYFRANPDSWNKAACDAGSGLDCQATQALRGSMTVSFEQASLALKNPAGKFAVVGLEHWALYDSNTRGDKSDYGLFTPNDNGYDGSAASTATSSGSCTTNHAYTQPAICLDANNNYQGLADASCTSGSSSPTWNPNFNGNTNDGSCIWFNEGPYSPKPESANWGNSLSPIANFNTAGICDP
jgi:Putative Ig domain